jgi:AcrR family transcriptional regulator
MNGEFAFGERAMPQVKKDDIDERISEAALRVFAARGYGAATVAEIARAARVSTGNVYRYYPSKEALFYAVVDAGFVRRLRRLLRARVRAAARSRAAWRAAAEELMRFALEHRREVVIALGRAAGSRYAALADDVVAELCALAIAHARRLRPGLRVGAPLKLALGRVYRGLVEASVAALAELDDEAAVREAIEAYARYHVAGLGRLFA